MKHKQAIVLSIQSAKNNTVAVDCKNTSQLLTNMLVTCGYQLVAKPKIEDTGELAPDADVFIDLNNIQLTQVLLQNILTDVMPCRIILFNANKSQITLEKLAIHHGIVGVFYANDPLELILKGLQQVKLGKLWYRRETLENMIQSLLPQLSSEYKIRTDSETVPLNNKAKSQHPLTNREMAIVNAIKQGAKNKEIASSLHISLNTVKTHIYSIFRKTSCRNRVEMITWSLKNEGLNKQLS